MYLRILLFLHICAVFYVVQWPIAVDSCNEAVCASIVSKCLITQACKCDLKNCSCCKDCFNCLNHLWNECCSCVEMCPKPNVTKSGLSKMSHVEDLPDPIPTLFHSLVVENDDMERWYSLTFPIDMNPVAYRPEIKKDPATMMQTNEQEVDPTKDIVTFNCSVAFMASCMPWNKCRASCQSMGANSYRWFHDGCCECIGEKCPDYGINESKCAQCPSPVIVLPDAELDFGEDESPDGL
ncbi:twisted gastrulation protein homolog 1-B-like [Planococcus citri]|uniref:twisted gastrulation protein homolog 1-B-like n=1 Tax=Planococcus citri TaxID=170843 RepID=UPI0031F945F2